MRVSAAVVSEKCLPANAMAFAAISDFKAEFA
jgi:hypothetical protein